MSEWINVNDKLPDSCLERNLVLIKVPFIDNSGEADFDYEIGIASFYESTGWSDIFSLHGEKLSDDVYISHCMPLPEPPKEKADE